MDSLFSQIDPGNIQQIRTIDGPYTSLLWSRLRLHQTPIWSAPAATTSRKRTVSTIFNYGTNGQELYGRENIWTGSNNWGGFISYGIRGGNDYHPGGDNYDFIIPAEYQRWDGMASLSFDVNRSTRIECDLLHTEYNHVDLPGIIYDLNNSTNTQFNVRYIVQEDRNGPQQLLVQAWHQETFFEGDSSQAYKFQTFFYPFITLPVENRRRRHSRRGDCPRPLDLDGLSGVADLRRRGLAAMDRRLRLSARRATLLGADRRRDGQRGLRTAISGAFRNRPWTTAGC